MLQKHECYTPLLFQVQIFNTMKDLYNKLKVSIFIKEDAYETAQFDTVLI
jgi:hypothetical protein